MKIGFSTSVIQRGKTGIAQYVFALLRAMDSLPADEQFVLFALEEDRPFFDDLSERFQISPVAEKFRDPIKNIFWHQRILPRLARDMHLNAIHVPSYRRLLWQSPCPRVATIHDLAPFRVSGKYDLARMIYGRVIVKHLARVQERIITVSGNTAADIERYFGIPRAKVRVIHNGLDHERFFPRHELEARAAAMNKFHLEKPFFLYIARLEHPGKNHVRLIEAFEKFKAQTKSDWLLALGGSDWHGAEAIHAKIASSPFKESIRALGFVSNEDLPLLYSSAAVFVYPSLYEGFGMPPVEAMACGCPVICSGSGSLAEVVADDALVINPEQPENITEALRRFYQQPATRADYVRKGLARARQFSWERAARDTLEVYSSLRERSRELQAAA